MANKDEKKPFDLDAFSAEETHDPFTFIYKGRTWTLAHAQELDAWETYDASGSGVDFLRIAFGDEQFTEFRAHGITQSQMNELGRRYREYCGVEGEEAASTSS